MYLVKISVNWALINLLKIRIPEGFVYNKHLWAILTSLSKRVWPEVNTKKERNIYKLSPVPPSIPSEALSVMLSWINSASNDIDGSTKGNFIVFFR